MSDQSPKELDPNILKGGDPPGQWRHRSVGPCGITYTLPNGVGIDGVDVPDDEALELALDDDDSDTDVPQDERDVEIWYVVYRPDLILYNHRRARTVIGEAVGFKDAARKALEFMRENPGEDHAE